MKTAITRTDTPDAYYDEDNPINIDVTQFPMKTEIDPEEGAMYDIIGIKNPSTTKIITEIKLSIESPVKIKSIEIKRLKHPSFYAEKTAEQLRPIVFPIILLKEKERNSNKYCEYIFRTGDLDYVNPKTSRYYLIKITPFDSNLYPDRLCYSFSSKQI